MNLYEFIFYSFKKINILFYRIFNFGLFRGVKLYGIPKIVKSKNVCIGSRTRINDLVYIHGAGGVSIGDNVTLSYGVTILSTGYSISSWKDSVRSKEHVDKKVVIDNDVWLCSNVTVTAGVKISRGIVVAAGSVVCKSITSEYSLYAGSPAKFIKKLA